MATTATVVCCCKERFCICFPLVRTEFCYALLYNFSFNNFNNIAFILKGNKDPFFFDGGDLDLASHCSCQ